MGEPAVYQHHAGIDALRTAALQRQLRRDLLPAAALLADQRVRRQQDVIEQHFAKMGIPCDVPDGTDLDAGQGKVEDHLRQPAMAVFRDA
ncbi:hypothetical protein D9M68_744500 [compost metagenome]